MTALLSVKSLHKSFGGVRAVRDVSFEVAVGSVFAIIGPNGAGKSTMLNLISGIYQPDAGTLSFSAAGTVPNAAASTISVNNATLNFSRSDTFAPYTGAIVIPIVLNTATLNASSFHVFGKYSGVEVKLGNDEIVVLKEEDILGVFE